MEQQLLNMRNDITQIKDTLLGNGKEIGVAEMARRAFKYMRSHDKAKNGLLDWTFRGVIIIVLGFIAVKVGLK